MDQIDLLDQLFERLEGSNPALLGKGSGHLLILGIDAHHVDVRPVDFPDGFEVERGTKPRADQPAAHRLFLHRISPLVASRTSLSASPRSFQTSSPTGTRPVGSEMERTGRGMNSALRLILRRSFRFTLFARRLGFRSDSARFAPAREDFLGLHRRGWHRVPYGCRPGKHRLDDPVVDLDRRAGRCDQQSQYQHDVEHQAANPCPAASPM
jgi:hypothetical protein